MSKVDEIIWYITQWTVGRFGWSLVWVGRCVCDRMSVQVCVCVCAHINGKNVMAHETLPLPLDENGREKWSDKRKPHKCLLLYRGGKISKRNIAG